jgi:hypothetical protein
MSLGCAILFTFLFARAEPETVVAALAKVGDEVITSRDLQIHLFLNEVDNPLKDFIDRKEPIKDLVYEHLIVLEAQSLLVVKVAESEVDAAENKTLKKFKDDRLWSSLSVSRQELRRHLQRKLMVKQILNLKMPRDLVSISDEAVESYYMQNKNQLGQKPLAELKDKIKETLKYQKNQERFKDWMSAVLRTHGVVYYSGYKIQ